MSGRNETLVAILRALRVRLSAPEDVALMDTAIGMLGPTKGALRQRRLEAKKRSRPDDKPPDPDALAASDLTSANHQKSVARPLPAPSPGQDSPRSIENPATEAHRSEGGDRAHAKREADANLTLASGAAATRTKSNEILLWDAWEEVAGGGMPMGSPPYHDLGIAWTASAARSPSDPIGAFRAAAVKFVALKRRTKSPAKLIYLCREIGDYLPAPSSAVEEPVLRRVKTLRELAAERDAEIAAKTPEQRAAELAALEAAQ